MPAKIECLAAEIAWASRMIFTMPASAGQPPYLGIAISGIAQRASSAALVDAFFERRAEHATRTGLLGEDDEPDIARIGARLELGFNLAAEIFSLLQSANLGQVLHDRNVGQMFPAIFTAQDLRLGMIESDDLVEIGVAVDGIPLHFHLHAN